MIVLHVIFLILVIVPTPTRQEISKYNKISTIDWSKCGTEAKCFCLKPDYIPSDDLVTTHPIVVAFGLQVQEANTPLAEVGACDIGIHSIYLNSENALFRMQIIGKDLKNSPKLMLKYGSEMLFGCEFGSKPGEVKLKIGNWPDNIEAFKKRKISLFEDQSRFESGNVVCAIEMRSADKFFRAISNVDVKYTTTMTVTTSSDVNYVREESNAEFFGPQTLKQCDPYLINDQFESPVYHVLPVKNRHTDSIGCTEYPFHKLKYTISGNDTTTYEAKELKCFHDPNSIRPYFTIVKEDTDLTNGSPDPLKLPAKYSFFCGGHFPELCTDPINRVICPSGNPECPIYTVGSKNTAAKLECPGNKWIIRGEYLQLAAGASCVREKGGKNYAAFYIKRPSRSEVPVESDIRCFTNYDCEQKSKLFLPSCGGANDTTCGLVDQSNGNLKCEDPTKKLTIYYSSEGKNFTLTNSSYTCDPISGSYINGAIVVPARARVRCIGEARTVGPTETKFSEAQINTYIGIAFASIVVVTAAVFLIYYFSMKSKKRMRRKINNTLIKMSRAQRIAMCKEEFEKAREATDDNATNIIRGLALLEIMLETETEEGECWEEACKFLARLRGTFVRFDNGLWHLFTRYLFLQAKNIIDKHDWIARERITKKNQKGLIRAAAIRLLSFAVDDKTNNETEQFIGSGYSKLGVEQGVEQYPHCGLLWALIMHARVAKTSEDKVEAGKQMPEHINNAKFLDTLMSIAGTSKLVLHKDDVIPAFGTIEEQAAFAIGAMPLYTAHMYKRSIKELYKINNGAVMRSYFKGMIEFIWRISMQSVYAAFGIVENEKETKHVAEATLIELATAGVSLLTYYGMHVDAQRLYVRFINKNVDEDVGQAIVDQDQFDEAVQKVKEKLRDWFAKRTDKEELKKKPEYTTNDKIKLDTRIGGQSDNGQSATGVDAATATKSDTKSNNQSKSDTKSNNPGSGGGSNSSDNAPAPTPKDAAAPAETPTPNAAAATPATP